MGVEIAFTKSSYYMSSLIRSVTHEDVSHCVIIIDDLWVIHSNFFGVHSEYIGDFEEHSTIVTRIPYLISRDRVYETLDRYHRSGYDYGAMLYSGLVLIARRLCPKFVPNRNLWQTTGMFLCTEFISEVLTGKEDALITPGQLRERLIAAS